MAVLIRPDGTARIVYPENELTELKQGRTSGHFTLAELQHHVGGYIELVPDPERRLSGLVMLVDEEGGPSLKKLQPNVTASVMMNQMLRGNALLLSRYEFDGPPETENT